MNFTPTVYMNIGAVMNPKLAVLKAHRSQVYQTKVPGLTIMDSTAVTLCMDNRMPIIVFDLFTEGNIERVILGEPIGTRVDAVGLANGA